LRILVSNCVEIQNTRSGTRTDGRTDGHSYQRYKPVIASVRFQYVNELECLSDRKQSVVTLTK